MQKKGREFSLPTFLFVVIVVKFHINPQRHLLHLLQGLQCRKPYETVYIVISQAKKPLIGHWV